MKKTRLFAIAMTCFGATVFMTSCGGNDTNTTPDETSIESEQMYERGGDPLPSQGAPTDTLRTEDTVRTL